ncbi:hypothetical protein RRG08_028872 [Elysia crispata]|uniref:Uncharacterized protein n=1 Tax=Elysia crispata TaxID=231223 RepID=A0AAE1D7S1_9GAST|nr:hypothetical protein RRG08_028872 [Elysia crispata]
MESRKQSTITGERGEISRNEKQQQNMKVEFTQSKIKSKMPLQPFKRCTREVRWPPTVIDVWLILRSTNLSRSIRTTGKHS